MTRLRREGWALPFVVFGASFGWWASFACSSASTAARPKEAGPRVMDASADVFDAARAPFEAGCFVPAGPNQPDAATAVIYGSCVPHFDGAAPICFESGHVGVLPDSGMMGAMLETSCTSASVEGTWSAGPCDLSTAVFGCLSETLVGSVCAEVTTTWYYPPTRFPDQVADCPPPLEVVLPPPPSDP